MKRYLETYLNQWVSSKTRKPLVLRGARQVGKTWVIRQLAQNNNLTLLEFNFERSPEKGGLFKSNDPKEILKNIEASMNVSINPLESLLFLDEIQAIPSLFAKLRWFYEEMPELRVVAAGSLLEFVLEDHDFSMPVGRIEYSYLEPLSFEEFLLATGQEIRLDFIKQVNLKEQISESIHQVIMDSFKKYSIVGGMPEAVKAWIDTESYIEVHKIHENIIAMYRDDSP